MSLKFDVMERECKNLEFGVYLNKANLNAGPKMQDPDPV
jgi:hypothetical protein